jgi:excisionase family DNA binding protein
MDEEVRPPYRIPEASRRLGISDQLTRKAILNGDLDAFQIGRTWLIRPESVDRLLRGNKRAPEKRLGAR